MRKDYTVKLLCKVLGVSRSGYYNYLKQPKKEASNRDKEDMKAIKKMYNRHSGTYGAKRISGTLKSKNKRIINHKRVARLMKEMNLKAKIRRPKVKKEDKVRSAGFVYPNLIDRNFDALAPNLKWVTDITELKVHNRKLYISSMMDLYNREIVSFVVSYSPNQDLIERTVRMAMKKRGLTTLEGVMIHSDQGSVYRSYEYNKLSRDLKFIPSMSRKANCFDNAAKESFFSHLKTEFPFFFPVESSEQVKEDLSRYVKYYNEERSQKRLKYMTPKKYLMVKSIAS